MTDFGQRKQNFRVDQQVMICNTNDPLLDGNLGTILGKASDHVIDFYIVLLDRPYNGQKAAVIPETCLCE